jgi:hypothetical protein
MGYTIMDLSELSMSSSFSYLRKTVVHSTGQIVESLPKFGTAKWAMLAGKKYVLDHLESSIKGDAISVLNEVGEIV